VRVERDRRDLREPFENGQPEREVRHEMVVHDVDVRVVRGADRAQVTLEVREVGGQDARVDQRRHAHSL
jgi:hypothetical protein